MAEFLDVAFDLLRSNKADSKKDAFEKVFKAIGLFPILQYQSDLICGSVLPNTCKPMSSTIP